MKAKSRLLLARLLANSPLARCPSLHLPQTPTAPHTLLARSRSPLRASSEPVSLCLPLVSAPANLRSKGSDTTAITMRALLRYIIGDRRIYDKVMAEIEEAIEEGNLNFPLSYAEATKLSYFQVFRVGFSQVNGSLSYLPAGLPQRDLAPAPCCSLDSSSSRPRGRRRSCRLLLPSWYVEDAVYRDCRLC